MLVPLKRDWDVPLQPPEAKATPQGYFAGRQRELELLAKGLLKGPRRSIFVWGQRGVGKTSLLYRALFDATDSAPAGSVIPVILNAAQLEAESLERTSSSQTSKEGDLGAPRRLVPRQIVVNLFGASIPLHPSSNSTPLYRTRLPSCTARPSPLNSENNKRPYTRRSSRLSVRQPSR